MAIHCPACGRALGLPPDVSSGAEGPCCAAARRGEEAPDLIDPFMPEDFGIAPVMPTAPASNSAGEAIIPLRPRLVPAIACPFFQT